MPPLTQVPGYWVSEDGDIVEVSMEKVERPIVKDVGDISGDREGHGICNVHWPVRKSKGGMMEIWWHLSCKLCCTLCFTSLSR